MAAPNEVTGELPTGAGVLRATIVPGEGKNRIQSVKFSGIGGDEAALGRLEVSLAGIRIEQAPGRIEDFFNQNPNAAPGVQPGEFLTAMTLAFMKVRLASSSAPDPQAWKKELGK
jgi:hypothetical protein